MIEVTSMFRWLAGYYKNHTEIRDEWDNQDNQGNQDNQDNNF
jgi:hypothetical protein